jgi:DNA polymerase-3 subunit epsilon
MSWINGPIAAYDCESTGTNVEEDRIVTWCVGLYDGKQWRETSGIVNPGIDIPKAATDVHGITTEHAKAVGMSPHLAVQQISYALWDMWNRGTPVVIYNAGFDLTILDRELRRNGKGPLEVSGPVLDPLCLDKHVDQFRPGSRKLIDTCRHYGVTLTEGDAHSASGDCLAAARLAWMLATKHAQLAAMSLEELHNTQVGWYAEQRSSFANYLRRQGKELDDPNTVWPLKPYADELAGAETL